MKKFPLEKKITSESLFRPRVGEVEPKRNNRFVIEFPEEFKIPSYCVQKVVCPKMTKGLFGFSWKDLSISFLDIIGPSASNSLFKNKNRKNFILQLSFLDPVGVAIETWNIHIQKIKSIDFGGKISYADDSLVEIKAVFKVKECVLL